MPSPALILWADSSRNAFASGWQSNLDAPDIVLRQGDALGVELHWVRRTVSLSSIMEEVSWPVMANITLAVGRLDAQPSSGTFTLTYGSSTTIPLNYNCTALQMESALNNLTPIATDGGVTVAKTSTSYRITWNDALVPSGTIAVGSNDLSPSSSIGVAVARAGTSEARAIVQLHIKQAPVAVCTTWATQDAPTVVVNQTHAPAYSGDYRIWRVKITPEPKGGSFRLSKTINSVTTWTAPLYYGATSDQVANAIGSNTTVLQVGLAEYEISQIQNTGESTVNITTIGSDSSGLIPYQSKYGVLDLNTLDLELLLAGAASAKAVLEIEVELDGTRETLVQKTITVLNDLIDTDSYTITTWGELIPADSVVRFDTSQALTTPQKTQARNNIDAISLGDLSSFTTKDTELEGRLGILEASISPDVQAAFAGASEPSSTNVFATMSDLDAKADLVHTHEISDVTGLITALSGKSEIDHTHQIADVDGLETALSDLDTNKANTVHTHTTSDVAGLDATITSLSGSITTLGGDISTLQGTSPTADEKAAMGASSSPSSGNAFVTVSYLENSDRTAVPNASTGPFDETIYPNEIIITVGGVQYAIPARPL